MAGDVETHTPCPADSKVDRNTGELTATAVDGCGCRVAKVNLAGTVTDRRVRLDADLKSDDHHTENLMIMS